jgi:hypothetical protein
MSFALRSLDWKTALGLLALAAFLLLASPGVRVARAEPLASDGAQCRAGTPKDAAPELSHLLDRLRAAAAAGPALAQRGADPEGWAPLDGRGYNYGAAPGSDAAALRRELEAR